MKDNEIIELYWERSDRAISETSNQYGKYCYTIAYNILYNAEDSEECVNDTWLHAWKVIPPQRPNERNIRKRWLRYHCQCFDKTKRTLVRARKVCYNKLKQL